MSNAATPATVTLRSPSGDYSYTYSEATRTQATTTPDGSYSRRVTASEQATVEAALRGAGWS